MQICWVCACGDLKQTGMCPPGVRKARLSLLYPVVGHGSSRTTLLHQSVAAVAFPSPLLRSDISSREKMEEDKQVVSVGLERLPSEVAQMIVKMTIAPLLRVVARVNL